MIQMIAETAWHHEGDFSFMQDLVDKLCEERSVDIVKFHITLDLDEYMNKDHTAYDTLKSWMLSPSQWTTLIKTVQQSGKKIMLLLNDTTAVNFSIEFNPNLIELHSVCLNIPHLQDAICEKLNKETQIVIGVGGCTLQEVDAAIHVFSNWKTVLMFGFQNYPTKYADVNLSKIRKIQALYPNKTFGYADHTAWDEKNNEMITLLVAANNMHYIEKHVTTCFGQDRCDYSAAISLKMFHDIAKKVRILNNLNGNGSLSLNSGEAAYSQYGPMKMAPVATGNIPKNKIFVQEYFHFCRTDQKTDLSQLETMNLIGKKVLINIKQGHVIQKDMISS